MTKKVDTCTLYYQMPLLLWWHCAIRILFIFVFCRVCAQRPDTVVYDEPLYAHFLRTHKEEQTWRPYCDEVFKQQVWWYVGFVERRRHIASDVGKIAWKFYQYFVPDWGMLHLRGSIGRKKGSDPTAKIFSNKYGWYLVWCCNSCQVVNRGDILPSLRICREQKRGGPTPTTKFSSSRLWIGTAIYTHNPFVIPTL